jgi:hypothetical protein
MKPEPMDKDQIAGIVQDAVQEAVSFIESEIAEDRIKSQRYFDGEVDIGQEQGRSKVVATKVRDVIRAVKPSLMRVFLSAENPVEYVPKAPKDVSTAQQATDYMQWVFSECGGYRVINDVFHDALVKRCGVAKVYWDTYTDVEAYTFSNLTEEEFTVIVSDDMVDVIEHSVEVVMEFDEFGMEIENPRHSLKVNKRCERGKLRVESVPPEEFMIDRNAKSIDDCYVVAHRTEMRVSDLVNMGYDFDEVSALTGIGSSDTYSEVEDFERRGYQQDEESKTQDLSMKLVAVTEAYMKMDIEGTGVAQMYKFMLGGHDYKLLDYEPWGEVPFAVFEVDPEPHAFFGRSLADLIMNDQDAATAMLRGVLDNVALTNNPRIGFVEGQVNVDDLMNNEIGGLIRMKTVGAIQDVIVPFIAGSVLPAIQYYDDQIEVKTGVSRASMGLDPDALQNTTATAAIMTAQMGASQIEVMARNLAEGGMKRLFKLMLKLFVENTNEEQLMRMNGQFMPIDPRSWNTNMDVSVNVGLGTGREEQRLGALQQTLQMQMTIWQTYGPGNGLVTMTQIRNTLADILALGGVRNAERYYAPMDMQTEQMLMMQQQQMAEQSPQSDPARALVEAETIKAQAKAQTDMIRAQIDAQKAIAQDDRERDKMDQDLILEAAKILGQYGQSVDVARIKQLQDEPRYPEAPPTEAVTGGRF